MKSVFAIAAVAGLAGAALAQDFTIYAVAPASANVGDTYTVEFWGQVEGGSFVAGTSAIAGFGVDALGTGNVAAVSTATIATWAAGFGVAGTVNGANVEGISGGQLANLFGFLNPNIDLSNPIMLFSIDVTVGGFGDITYVAGNPNPNGGLSYYPVSTDGASVVAPNHAGTTLTFISATTSVVPAPASLALLGLGGLVARRRR
ncbi:MAG: PEP-CTERM sorting domain-containing protein [Leptolyngbya sp. PLA3]|nr:MAG: PEP-CTERM sorting domain-containing protein [Cyanobacteria bacterium CYA]MCE7969306.1 PEP-CTERM sorting domain-containing protein [Leptolyngbya sp. PL-A3]